MLSALAQRVYTGTSGKTRNKEETHLRNSRKKYKKRYGSKDRRGQIRDRTFIDKRPPIVDRRDRIGDWEIDTVIGKNNKGALVTILERKSHFTLMKILSSKRSELVTRSVMDLMKPLERKVCTITADKGKEFA